MKVTVRTRILATYLVLVLLFFGMLFMGLSRLKVIGAKLNLVQSGYLPIVKTVNSFFNLYHLEETFDVPKVVANRSNRLFLEAVSVHNPKLLESSLQRGLSNARIALKKYPSEEEEKALNRLESIFTELLKQHGIYTNLIREAVTLVQSGQTKKALLLNDSLTKQKRLVRSRIDYLSRRLDDRIQQGIRTTTRQERDAVVLTLILFGVTLLCALVIGGLAIVSLRPLELLKKAAREIGAGDLGQRVPVVREDEVGSLAKEFNRMADSIQRQQEQLLQSERMAVVGRMASKISHEVRNPLNALSLNVEMLQDEVTGGAQKTLKAISTEIERLNLVVENYLNMARGSAQKTEVTDLNELLSHVETLVRSEATHRQFLFEMQWDKVLPKLRLTGQRLEQAILNLTRNAMDALPAGGAFGIKAVQNGSKIIIDVWDRGAGIAEKDLPHIFEPFYTTKEKGTGLGLSITQEIIREQGGQITCKSQVNIGTTFTIEFPHSNDV